MTFYNHIESVRYEMFRLVDDWTRKGAETKARISKSLDKARGEYMQKESENVKLKAQVEALKDYAHALELCRNKAYLCEYCTFNGIDFDHDDINCTIDFDGLQKKAGCRNGGDN